MGSRTKPLQTKAESITKSSISGKRYIKKGVGEVSCWGNNSSRERSENMQEQQLCRHQSECRQRGRRCCRCWCSDPPAAHGEPMEPLQPVEVHSEADALAAHGGPQDREDKCLKEAVT